ncbi:aminotransferase class III-fold pyridoxal phosphate-dependent enzyme [Pseudobacteriovorax antillogorgiicola]|uniref:L-lysine 6-transaminase n=1 Tax=Pseudobacteriovorax antillogorgiicola TaxID=1513793 RepID=A0A1Y6BWV7_9BACT|nr:aminotransferase class III-fold pyridoxal phosphate-dependent enzyme [Pseudobacteriovorax antillogorgiicola]TCS50260.1 L-lysine 6-transaminase precursor [Pseudobacteriovorax antillogorgiicola]SMF33024.1 L-lysine 6-transaminase precursor [Pseudobacteriovorax antillogorgiicola]
MEKIEKLHEIRKQTGAAVTTGLEDEILAAFLDKDPSLGIAIDEAYQAFQELAREHKDMLTMDETKLVEELQAGYLNFYAANAVNPYVSLSAKGPWLVTSHGAVLHDSGGYGMLGFGHSPDKVLDAMNGRQVMANVMTAHFSQKFLVDRLKKEVGHTRSSGMPFKKFVCLNSGSESVTVAARISDLNARVVTDPGGRYEGRTINMLAMKGGFHGRTDRPAQASDSSLKSYQKLASFRDRKNLITVEPNNVDELRQAFAQAEKDNVFIEMVLLEPVMGEGNPGVGVTREFYDEVRKLTKEHGCMMLVDSIQAGLRAHGCLSITDYPGFQDCEAPDLETYSKAVNAGQYPLSILALNDTAAGIFQRGIYGNTMTTNPRALDVACAVLDSITPELRKNIVERGKEFIDKFKGLQKEFPDIVTGVSGTGLLCALHLKKDGFVVVGDDCVEAYMRKIGIGVIHGGENALRFTPHFNITSAEVDLIIDKIRETLKRGPVYK